MEFVTKRMEVDGVPVKLQVMGIVFPVKIGGKSMIARVPDAAGCVGFEGSDRTSKHLYVDLPSRSLLAGDPGSMG